MTQPPPRTRPGAQAHPGDTTGRKREQLAREHSEEIAAREGEISMVNAERARSTDEDVVDPMTREVFNPIDGTTRKMDAEVDDAPRILGAGNSAVEEIPENRPTGTIGARANTSQEYLNEKVIVRVNTDLEDVTLGYGNQVSFIEGRKYRVPRWVAQHLEEKGLIWH